MSVGVLGSFSDLLSFAGLVEDVDEEQYERDQHHPEKKQQSNDSYYCFNVVVHWRARMT